MTDRHRSVRRGDRNRPGRRLALLIGTGLLLALAGSAPAATLRQIPAVIHSHTTWSTGDQPLDQLAERARERGIEAVFLAENFLQRFEYGLFPLRRLLRHRVEYPSLLQKGPAEFLAAVAEVNRRQSAVRILPGVELIPHYYWTGGLFRGSLTMHNGQKNLLALGLGRPEDYLAMPVIDNPGASRWTWESLWLLSPTLLVVGGLFLLTIRRKRTVKLERLWATQVRRPIIPGLLCAGLGMALLANNYPFRPQALSPYDAEVGLLPYQTAIDYVAARGGLAVWSLPEARDFQEVQVAGLRATIRTDPYPEDLLRTDGFAAFGGIYEDTTTFTQPGGGWDTLLMDYLAGRRRAPAWAIGEAAYHYEGQAGKRFGEVRTVLLAERNEPGLLLEALRVGRLYALGRTVETGLTLERFQAMPSQGQPVEAGGKLAVDPDTPLELRVAVGGAGPKPLPVEVRLIRSGALVHTVKGQTPVAFAWTDRTLRPDGRVFYRLEVLGPPGHRILANPIFVTVRK